MGIGITALALAALLAPQARGPGLGNLTYDESELFQPLAVLVHPNGYTSSTMVHGYFMTVAAGDVAVVTKALEFWDLSDPRNPVRAFQHADARTNGLREAHTFGLSAQGYGSEYAAFMGSRGFQIWDLHDPANPVLASDVALPNLSSLYGEIFWLFWQPPYLYFPGASSGLYVIRVDDPANPVLVRQIQPAQLSGIAPNQVFVCGTLMVLVRSQEQGFATFDLTDPENPVPLDLHPGARGYSHVFAAGKLLTSGGDGGPVQMFVHEVGHDGSLSLVGSSSSAGFSNGAYGSYQDGFFHTGMSNSYAKFDVATLTEVGRGTTSIPNRDEDQCQVLGNLAFVGDDHGVGSGLYVHDTQPDSRGPSVAWVHPADGAGGVPPAARVGVSMTDNVDFLTVNGATFRVQPVGGAPLPGKYGVQMGLLNFCPDAPLAPNTVYEVRVDGVEDLVGNSGPAFRSTFTTGTGAPSGPAVGAPLAASGEPYRLSTMRLGAPIYIDRDYLYTSYPARFEGQPYVLTANDDKFATGSPFLSFPLAAGAKVCVLYDDRATRLPAWLDDPAWTATGEKVNGGYDVYERDFTPGSVGLGGNANAPMAGAQSNYGVVVIPAGLPPSASFAATAPAPVATAVSFTADPPSGTPPFQFSWSFGDGTPPTAPSTAPDVQHAFDAPGRFPVVLTVTNAAGSSAASAVQVVHTVPTPAAPTSSSSIVHTGSLVAVVSPDGNTVAGLDPTTLAVLWEAPVDDGPRTLALAPGGELWVVCQETATIVLLRASDGARLSTLPLPRGSRPHGIAFAPDGRAAYATLEGGVPPARLGLAAPRPGLLGAAAPADRFALARVLALDPTTGAVLAAAVLDGRPRGIAVSHDASRVLVARHVTPHPERTGLVWELDPDTLETRRELRLAFDPGPDTERSGRGAPNYLGAPVISPDGTRVLVPSKKDNVARGLFRDGRPLTFESRTRTILSVLELPSGEEDLGARLDLNDRDLAQAAAFSPLGDLVLVATQGSNVVDVFETESLSRVATFPVGKTPQGLVFAPDGSRLFVHDFLDRTVTVLDTSGLVAGTLSNADHLASVPVVSSEPLAPQVLAGKRVFHDASDRRMNLDGYLSCASCHQDGESDGQVWDFTQSGEGLRNTIPLLGRAGLGHGNVHWTANFDEIQDFEIDVREGFAGAGFLLDPDFAATAAPLGPPKAGLSPDLDALAAYVGSLDELPPSPYRSADGSLTAAGRAGRRHFQALGCASCHAGPERTDGLRHDVGTLSPGSGQGSGQPLAGVGIETPTLRGLWLAPPYLHDGSAPTVPDVLRSAAHGGADALTERERVELALYLLQIE